jgi:hypothetical protein
MEPATKVLHVAPAWAASPPISGSCTRPDIIGRMVGSKRRLRPKILWGQPPSFLAARLWRTHLTGCLTRPNLPLFGIHAFGICISGLLMAAAGGRRCVLMCLRDRSASLSKAASFSQKLSSRFWWITERTTTYTDAIRLLFRNAPQK